ncbi:MAG: alpha amylase N-terminal ig-like domain-containing protein [Christensenellales bacterium]
MKSLQIAAIRHMPWLEDRHTLSDGRVCIRLTTAVNEFDAVTLRHADHYAEGEPFARATDTPMERMWCDENHEVWQAVFRPHDPRIVYAFILRAGDVTLLHDADGTRAVPEKPEWVNGFHYAHAYPAKEKPQWGAGASATRFSGSLCRVDVPGRRPSSRGQQARGERISLRRQPRAFGGRAVSGRAGRGRVYDADFPSDTPTATTRSTITKLTRCWLAGGSAQFGRRAA